MAAKGDGASTRREGAVVRSSELRASPGEIWAHVTSPKGVNLEFHPLLRMTFPADTRDLTHAWRPGERLFRSWILLFGILPVEYDDLAFVEIDPGRRFLERSRMLTQSIWEHERTVEPLAAGCRLTDRVRFVPRIGWLTPVYARVFDAVFAWRHRNLRKLFASDSRP